MEISRRTAFSALSLVCIAGCRGKHSLSRVQNEEETTPRLASVVRMGDPAMKGQLLSGFFGVENNSWRWTGRKFSVLLRVPAGAAERGATLSLALNIPDVVIQNLHEIKLTASIGTSVLSSVSYTAPGSSTFIADVPGSLLTAVTVTANFELDKTLPVSIDQRQLGIVAVSATLATK